MRRLVTVLGVGTAVGALVAAGVVTAPTPTPGPAAGRVQVDPTPTELVCAGPQTALAPQGARPAPAPAPALVHVAIPPADPEDGPASGEDGLEASATLTPLSVDDSSIAAEPASGTEGSRPWTSVVLEAGAASGGVVTARAGGVLVTAGRAGATEGHIAARQAVLVRDGDLRGLAASACRPATAHSWLVGGGTEAGRRVRLLLANPGASPAVVDLTVLTGSGPVHPPAGQGLTVEAGSQRAVLLDALVPGVEHLAVDVVARGAPVVATLHDSVLRGLTPGGADDIGPSAGPARRQVVPGIVLRDESRGSGDPDGLGPGPHGPAVRIAVPGAADAVVRVSLLGAHGEVQVPDAAVVTVPAGSVVDVPLDGVPAGAYAAVLESSADVLAGAVLTRGGPPGPAELAWTAATEPITGRVAVPLPEVGITAELVLTAAEGDAVMRLAPVSSDGRLLPASTVRIVAGTTTVRSVGARGDDDPVAVLVEPLPGAGPVTAAVLLSAGEAGELVSVVPIVPVPAAPEPVTVRIDPRVGLPAQASWPAQGPPWP